MNNDALRLACRDTDGSETTEIVGEDETISGA